MRHLSFQNQFLLWSTYVQPYFHYVSPIVHTQPVSTQRVFHTMWRASLKCFLRLPLCVPSVVLDRLLQ